ncbi:MAG: UDP-N-acetylmuramoyl-tripeptide--D-alanyl-D-alanine ligase [Candidatus Planktophila sp.]
MKATEIAAIVGGVLHGSDVDVTAPAFIASKECVDGSIFLAIKGSHVDGHDFVADAFVHGAVLAFVTHQTAERCIVVDDVTQAVSALALHVRNKLSDLKVIGITGSQGKTTTKDLLNAVLSSDGSTIATRGNNNNELGVPLTVLRCNEETRYCIVEMGARHLGDIKQLTEIARPHIGVVLRVAAAHIGEFGSIENIAQAKSEMISSLGPDAIAIVGTYDEFTSAMSSLHRGTSLKFGEEASCDIRATDIELRDGCAHFDLVTPEGRTTVALRQYGLHQIPNALAAAAVAHALGVSTDHIAGALSVAEMHSGMRMEVKVLTDLTLINDSYNASPDSMSAALSTLAHLTQERGGESWAFLGNMRELGEASQQAHAQIGVLCTQLGIDHLVTINAPDYGLVIPADSLTSVHACATQEEALQIATHINRGDVILCKGSRSEKLELVAEGIVEMWEREVK